MRRRSRAPLIGANLASSRQPQRFCRGNVAHVLPRHDCAKRVVTTRWQPVVTTRRLPQQTTICVRLAQVTTSSDGLPAPSSTRTAQCGPHPARSPRAQWKRLRRRGAPRALGQRLNSTDQLPTGSPVDADAACRGGKQQRRRHEAGVMSRVPRSSRSAQAPGTDRNTDLTDRTPAMRICGTREATDRTKGRTPTPATECMNSTAT